MIKILKINSIISLFVVVATFTFKAQATIDIGLGTSSFTYGRNIPSLDLTYNQAKWSFELQSEGVQTSVYSQDAWTISAYKNYREDKFGQFASASIGAGFGAAYLFRTYRESLTSSVEETKEYVVGPFVSAKYRFNIFYLSFNILLGITSKIQDHILLNYQDMSHITFGISL